MFKRISWFVLFVLISSTLSIGYIVTLVRYAEAENGILDDYRASILAMEDVNSVNTIHRFNGLESYIVADIDHQNGENLYFFIRDGLVQHFFFTNDLIDAATAGSIATAVHDGGTVSNITLGILHTTPIFEVQINQEEVVYYVVVNAITREIVMNFAT